MGEVGAGRGDAAQVHLPFSLLYMPGWVQQEEAPGLSLPVTTRHPRLNPQPMHNLAGWSTASGVRLPAWNPNAPTHRLYDPGLVPACLRFCKMGMQSVSWGCVGDSYMSAGNVWPVVSAR